MIEIGRFSGFRTPGGRFFFAAILKNLPFLGATLITKNLPDMRAQLLALAFVLAQTLLSAQILDNFSDGNLAQNPVWAGNVDHFTTNLAGELQLNAPAAGNSLLFTEGNIPDSAVWEIYFRLEFPPSATNRLRIYLQTDGANLQNANGYFLEIGENGTADALKFYRQDAGQPVLLGSGTAATLANEPSLARLQIFRKKGNLWKIGADFSGNDNFLPQIEVADGTWPGGENHFFGLDCLFSASRKDKFFFDEIKILPDLPDISPPKLLAAEAIDSQTLLVFFDEKLDPVEASDPVHFSVDLNIGKPISAEPLAGNVKAVRLFFSKKFLDGKTHVLTTTGLTDEIGNASISETAPFYFLKISPPALFDILINEIMADPSPSAGLPEFEWIELLNRSAKNIDLQQVTFSAGGAPVGFPKYILRPDSLVWVGNDAAGAAFFLIKNKISVPSFPSISNSADELTLADVDGETIDFVPFDLSFYKNDAKKDGGWSLERINPNRPCAANAENWAACKNLPGGSPGLLNSHFFDEKDSAGAELIGVFPKSATLLRVQISEGLAAGATADFSNFKIEPALPILSVEPAAAGSPFLLVSLGQPMQPSQIYFFKIAENAVDCSGNFFSNKNELPFALPEPPEANDLIINELLFNPLSGGADFLEIFNRSKKVIDLSGLFVANISGAGAEVKKCAVERLIFPGEFAVLTTDTADVLANFFVKKTAWLHQNALPGFADDNGNVRIYRENGPSDIVVLDDFDYSKDLHHALLTDLEKENRSLERLDASVATTDPANWMTAAASNLTAGHGTPTTQNSQSQSAQFFDNEWVTLSSGRVSPDGDGYEDFILIDLNLPSAGFSGHIDIYSEDGRRVKTISGQQISGVNPRFRWDGDFDDGGAAPVGIYILQAGFLHPDGKALKKNLTVAVVKKWD